jgi:hypothetical protein
VLHDDLALSQVEVTGIDVRAFKKFHRRRVIGPAIGIVTCAIPVLERAPAVRVARARHRCRNTLPATERLMWRLLARHDEPVPDRTPETSCPPAASARQNRIRPAGAGSTANNPSSSRPPATPHHLVYPAIKRPPRPACYRPTLLAELAALAADAAPDEKIACGDGGAVLAGGRNRDAGIRHR